MKSNQLLQYRAFKRILDLVFSSILLVLLFPVLLVIYLVIYFETGMNPLFTQQRGIVLERNIFRIYKFRTLKANSFISETTGDIFIKNNKFDTVTYSGHFLRKSGLDELPQLINILRGEMSFIGPRPLSVDDLEVIRSTEPLFYNLRSGLTSKPGISGYWQIFGNRMEGTKNLLECEEEYEKSRSFIFDTYLVFMTLPVILFGKHADSIINTHSKETPVQQYLIDFQERRG